MKPIFYLRLLLINILILTSFLNCESNEVVSSNNQENLKENSSNQYQKTELDNHQFTDYRDALDGVIEDKDGFF